MTTARQELLLQDLIAFLERLRSAGLMPGVVGVHRLDDNVTEVTKYVGSPVVFVTDLNQQETEGEGGNLTDVWEHPATVIFAWPDGPDGRVTADARACRQAALEYLSGWRPPSVVGAGPGRLEPQQIAVMIEGQTDQRYGGIVARWPVRTVRRQLAS